MGKRPRNRPAKDRKAAEDPPRGPYDREHGWIEGRWAVDWQSLDGTWNVIVEDVNFAEACRVAQAFRYDNPDLETRVR